jgi:hypothetical protein
MHMVQTFTKDGELEAVVSWLQSSHGFPVGFLACAAASRPRPVKMEHLYFILLSRMYSHSKLKPVTEGWKDIVHQADE